MAIKSGSMIHDAQGFVIDRIQTGGVSNLNIPQEKIYELGNWQSVATIRDVPDLSFEMESFDVSTEIEALLTGKTPTATIAGDEFDFTDHIPLDVISPFKDQNGSFTIVKGLSLPYLTLESATYRFGVRQSSTQQFTLRGDAIYYIPGTPKQEKFTLVNNTLTYTLANTALLYQESGDNIYILSACVKNPTTGIYRRLFFGQDYTNSSTQITLLTDWFDSGYTELHVTYGTATTTTYPQSVHQDSSVKPAAVRGKDIDVYIASSAATPTLARWTGVQSFEVTRRVNLDADEEFGNTHYIAQDYDTADVTGSITLKPQDTADLWAKIRQVSNISSTSEVIGPYSSQPLKMELRINDPDTGALLKTLYIPDARFTPPPIQGRVQQKFTPTFSFSSDGGQLLIYQGARP